MYWLVLLALILLTFFSQAAKPSTKIGNLSAKIAGDVIFGGLFSIRRGEHCEHRTNLLNIRRVEAMLYAIEQINANSSILPNITLGADIRDDCYSETVALDESLDFILDAFSQNEKNICSAQKKRKPPVMGVVGTGSSGTSLPVAGLLRLFRLPQVSYAATSPDLSNREDYSYFTRVVPSDECQAHAMLDIIDYFNWTAVYLISSSGNYGKRLKEAFVRLAKNRSVCIVDLMEIGAEKHWKNGSNILMSFLQKIDRPSVRVVVLLTEAFHNKEILEGVKKANISHDRFIWLGSDTWGTGQPLDGVEDIANGAISIALHVPSSGMVTSFDEYFTYLTPENNSQNPWFDYFWEESFKCSLPGTNRTTNYTKQCTGNETFEKFNWTDDKTPYVLDSVYALAYSLHRMLHDTCSTENWNECLSQPKLKKVDLLNYLFEANFSGASGIVKFDASGNGMSRYDIMSYTDGEYKKMAVWNEAQSLLLKLTEFHQRKKRENTLGSSCVEDCKLGEASVPYLGLPSCCRRCRECLETEFVNSSHQCERCPERYRPNKTKTGCESLPEGHPAEYVVVVLAVWASSGLLITAFVFFTVYKFYSTPIIMASGRELMIVLLVGIALCHTLGFALLGPPTVNRCSFQRFGSGFFLAVCYSAILVKTNRIARIFRGRHRPAFITPGPQLLITALLFSVQLGISCAASFLGTSSQVTTYSDKEFVYHVCRTSGMEYVISIGYNVLLVLLCTCYAFLTRKLPANFNEAKKVGMTMYASCVLWICFMPLFYGTVPVYQTAVLLLNSCFNATVLLIGIFGHKVYVVWLRPEKNTRQASNPRGRTGSAMSQSAYSIHSLHMDDGKKGYDGKDGEEEHEVFC